MAEPAWHPDPLEEYQYRWWDGDSGLKPGASLFAEPVIKMVGASKGNFRITTGF